MTDIGTLARRMMPLPGHVLAGVSGGADSVALLLALVVLRDECGLQVNAVHVNHGLRGAASDGDEAFVRALCCEKAVPLCCFRADPPQHPGEAWAREARYGFFREAMRQTGAEALVLAHHRDDQAETLLLHLLRGAGLEGLTGMARETVPDGMRVIRPLLDISRAELREALTESGQAWREDATNEDTKYLRNAVRLELLPLMERLAPGAAVRLAQTASLLRADANALGSRAAQFLTENAGEDWLDAAALAALDEGMRARVVRAWWQRACGTALDQRQTKALADLARAGRGAACSLPERRTGLRGWRCIHLIPPEAPEPLPSVLVTAEGAAFGGFTLTLLPGTEVPGDGKTSQRLPRTMVAGCEVRTRRQGDFIRPFGSAGSQSLQDYLVNRRIDAPFRDRIPLLCRGSEVLLVCGVGAGGVPRADSPAEQVLAVWSGDMPWRR